MSIGFTVNGQSHRFCGDIDMLLLWYLRKDLKLKGSKYGCGIGQRGACTVRLNGKSVRYCAIPNSSITLHCAVVTIASIFCAALKARNALNIVWNGEYQHESGERQTVEMRRALELGIAAQKSCC